MPLFRNLNGLASGSPGTGENRCDWRNYNNVQIPNTATKRSKISLNDETLNIRMKD